MNLGTRVPWSRLRRIYNPDKKSLWKQASNSLFLWIAHLLLYHEISGVDALRGYTRSHPEHDG